MLSKYQKTTSECRQRTSGTQKSNTSLQKEREEIQLHPPEHQHKLPEPGNLDKPPVQTHTQRGKATIKRTPQTARIQKSHPKLSNLKQDEETEEYPGGKGTG